MMYPPPVTLVLHSSSSSSVVGSLSLEPSPCQLPWPMWRRWAANILARSLKMYSGSTSRGQKREHTNILMTCTTGQAALDSHMCTMLGCRSDGVTSWSWYTDTCPDGKGSGRRLDDHTVRSVHEPLVEALLAVLILAAHQCLRNSTACQAKFGSC